MRLEKGLLLSSYMEKYFRFSVLLFLCIPLFVFAADIVNAPKTQNTITQIEEPARAQEIYGELHGYPHTFEFTVKEGMQLSLQVQIPQKSEYKKSLIVIKEERRGVSEVGRVSYDENDWQKDFDWRLGRGFETQEALETELGKGVYRIEVSSPENLGKYKLTLGTESRRGYFDQFSHAWTGALFFGVTPFAVLRSPIVLVTLFGLLVLLYFGRKHWKEKYA